MSAEVVTVLGMALNFLASYLVKKGTTFGKVIPVLNIVIGILTQVAAAMTQATPAVAPAVAVAGIFGTFGKGFLDAFVNGIIQGILTTGIHSSQKNLMQVKK